MIGRITKGTTLVGKAINAGDVVDISPEDYHQFKMTGDIEPVEAVAAAEPVEVEPPVEDPKSAKKPKK